MEVLTFLLIIVSSLTVLSLGVSVGLACFIKEPNSLQSDIAKTCATMWKIGFGAILGLFPEVMKL
ncbi:MAG: hypothetical protein GY777_26655 [Candidatus Brocadiaceae bacterium]|nr:hypothetical protein [Candidatus Brocadiaceae bacterium]